MKEISIIVACSTEYGIGFENDIPWDIPEELKQFQKITTDTMDQMKKNCIIMGKNTWLSLPKRPLKNRLNIVISSEGIGEFIDDNVKQFKNISEALEYANKDDIIEKIFFIGGAKLYETVFDEYHQFVDKIYLSIIYDKNYKCDKFISGDTIYQIFHFDKENIHFTEKYVFMIGYNKNKRTIS